MISKKIALIGFAFLCLIQLYIAGGMVRQNEGIMRTGEVIKLRTAPLDPNDPFRGKYITLDFPDIAIKVNDASIWAYDDIGYVIFQEDSAGFHIPFILSKEIPSVAGQYLKVKIKSTIETPGEQMVYIEYPFDRFYLQEEKAPLAEEKYREALSDPGIQTYAKVYIQDGQGVIDNVFIGEQKILDLVE